MSIASKRRKRSGTALPPPLHNGDRLTQAEFHRRYEAYPEDVKFELVGGTVYMASPLRRRHAWWHVRLSMLLGLYEMETPGVEALDNATTILGKTSEPQPDLALRILPEFGGQSVDTADDYVDGAPELLLEVAYSTQSIDLQRKKADYQAARVQEYVVLCIEEKELHWFNFKSRRAIAADAQGICRSKAFAGLWIDGPALLGRQTARAVEVLRQGLASPEHAAFVKRLQAARRKRS
jgi:Uma2 family endonuclease